jgi:predicted nucleotidyltransferase
MIASAHLVAERIDDIHDLCRRYHVARLELFGSAASGQFNETTSDLDFLIEFETLSPSAHADAYFGMLADLQDLFCRDIDLVEVAAVTNPYFKQTLDVDRTVLYAA